jgi:N-dimethylarginine dimethylaminohydrolase
VNRLPRQRSYLMCVPEQFTVAYAINPWMDVANPVDTARAIEQWYGLRDTLIGLGHRVHTLEPLAGLPDMVYAANGAFSVDGVVYGARFRYPQRSAEAAGHRSFYLARAGDWQFVAPRQTNEGEGDFAYLPQAYGGLILAGYGFRTDQRAHAEAQQALGRPVVSLQLVDPRFYHLDVALGAVDDTTIAYFPGAFSPASQRVLRQLFPDAVLADEADALAFGLNLVSDGRRIVMDAAAPALAGKLAAAGYEPMPVEMDEIRKGGGSVKCCVAELRPLAAAPPTAPPDLAAAVLSDVH